jgi:O-antigen/teichoic acid export membrane protein
MTLNDLRIMIANLTPWRPGKLAKDTLSMTSGMGLRTISQAVVFLILARILGVEAYGAYTAILALAITFGGLVGFGASSIMLRDTARNAELFTESWGRTLSALLLTAPIFLIVYFILSWAILPRQVGWSVIFCIGIAEILLSPLTIAVIEAYQGHERIGRSARVTLAQTLPRLAASLLIWPLAFVLVDSFRLPVWAALYLIAAASSAVYALKLLKKDIGAQIVFHWHGLSHTLSEAWPFSMTGTAQKVYADIDKVMLSRLSTLEITGTYSAAYRLVDMTGVPLISFFSATAPRFFRAGHDGMQSAARYALRLLPLPMIYTLVIGVSLYMLAGLLPWLLGSEFVSAVEALRLLAWLPLIATPRRFMQTALYSSGRQRATVLIVVFGAILNAILNLWMIPLWNWRGALSATYASELAMNSLFFFVAVHGWCKVGRDIKDRT